MPSIPKLFTNGKHTRVITYMLCTVLIAIILLSPISLAQGTLKQESFGLTKKIDYDTYASPSDRDSTITLTIPITDGNTGFLTDATKKVTTTLDWGGVGIIATATVVHFSGYVDDKGNLVFKFMDDAAGGWTSKKGPSKEYEQGHLRVKVDISMTIQDHDLIKRQLWFITVHKVSYIKASSSTTAELKLEVTIEGFGGGIKIENTYEEGEYYAVEYTMTLPYGEAYEYCDAKVSYAEYINGQLSYSNTKLLHSEAVIEGIVYRSWGS
ncbi:MAG: hypothetical protein GXO43_05295 [Crenarchaeota archaeon]|nr:hypothetical protein [Thermoproteota archaeon]